MNTIHHRLKKILLSHHIYSKKRLQFKFLASCWCAANTDLEEKLQVTPRYNECEMQVTKESSPWHRQNLDLTSAENLNKEIFKSLGLSDKEGPTLTQSPQAISKRLFLIYIKRYIYLTWPDLSPEYIDMFNEHCSSCSDYRRCNYLRNNSQIIINKVDEIFH